MYSLWFPGFTTGRLILEGFFVTMSLAGASFLLSFAAGYFVVLLSAKAALGFLLTGKKRWAHGFSAGVENWVILCSSPPSFLAGYAAYVFLPESLYAPAAAVVTTLGAGLFLGLATAGAEAARMRASEEPVIFLLANGIPEKTAARRAALNAMADMLPCYVKRLPLLASVSLVAEIIFVMPGLSLLAVYALIRADVPVLVSVVVLYVLVIRLLSLGARGISFFLSPYLRMRRA